VGGESCRTRNGCIPGFHNQEQDMARYESLEYVVADPTNGIGRHHVHSNAMPPQKQNFFRVGDGLCAALLGYRKLFQTVAA
jgi:hypothetical protein